MINFEQGEKLANRQQKVFENLDHVYPSDISALKGNLWVKSAISLAPSNLVVRHSCLLDMISRKPDNFRIIANQLIALAPDLWVEGYSYWLYTKPFLKEYAERVNLSHADKVYIKSAIQLIDQHFIDSSYIDRIGQLRPAPFGDLRDITLEETLEGTPKQDVNLTFLKKEGKIYNIKTYNLGFNTHVPVESKPTVINGKVYGFRFYTGYENKYSSKREEIADTFSLKRILSLFK